MGNTIGGFTSYALGWLVPERTQKELDPRAMPVLKHYGSLLTFFAWLPAGDALRVAAGWLRLTRLSCTALMAAGRAIRYIAVGWPAG
ncbi:MAG: hypothetical protein HY017_29900 [Betaproteobacteria bacterium]|nr:hypothetical protein [Betaproteobacteria bacterium]